MVAVLHHLDFESALTHARQLLNPGGRLLVIGLPKVIGAADLIWDLPSLVLNPIVGIIRHPHAVGESLPTSVPRGGTEHALLGDQSRCPRAVARCQASEAAVLPLHAGVDQALVISVSHVSRAGITVRSAAGQDRRT
jgi:hypothetical protein